MYDELTRENDRYTSDVRNRAARIMREEGVPMFDAMDRAQNEIAAERKASTRQEELARINEFFSRQFRRNAP